MSQIGSLVASANQTFNLDFLPSVVVIEDPVTALPITSLSVVTGGNQVMSITSQARIQALAKFQQGAVLGGSPLAPMSLNLAMGRVNKQTTINMLNGAATTPAVFASSAGVSTVARSATETSINASANGSFSDFEAIFFDPTNVLRAQITFENGFADEFSVPEIDALFARFNICDANGRLAGLSCINGEGVKQVVLYNGSGGSTIVLKSAYLIY